MTDPPVHKRTVRSEFTKQAVTYAASPVVSDPEAIGRLVEITDAHEDARVLEVATGPGHVAFAFADRCESVTGVDLTEAPLDIARKRDRERDRGTVSFAQGDAESLPFSADSFDIVVCRLALHHIETPAAVVREIIRVCRPAGTVGIADLVVSEHTDRGEYQNEFERLRDPSHVRTLPISELLTLLSQNGLEVAHVETDVLVQEVESWMETAQTPASQAPAVREMIKRDAKADLSGTRPFWDDGELYFVQRTARIAGHPLEKSQ